MTYARSSSPIGSYGGRAKTAATNFPTIPGVSSIAITVQTHATGITYYERMYVENDAAVLDELWIEVTVLAASGKARLAVFNADVNWQPTSLVVGPATELDTNTTGVKKLTGLATSLPRGRYLKAMRFNVAAPELRVARGSPAIAGTSFGTSLGNNFVSQMRVTEAYGTWAANGTDWDTGGLTGSGELHGIFCVLSAV